MSVGACSSRPTQLAADTNEKRTVGALWEKTSGGKGLFIVIEKDVDGKDVRTQLLAKFAPQK
jgi:type III restriction enzyme